jgi:elongation factor 2
VYPDKGTVSFSAGLHAWAFTLTTFAQMYAAKFGTDEQKMMEKLWGDNFFDPATRKWTKKATDSKTCVRGFVQFCYNPIRQVRSCCWTACMVLCVTAREVEQSEHCCCWHV